jgi:hypothetical protein
MKKFILLGAALLAGCGALKTKTHGFFCAGVCLHNEIDVDKKKGEDPKVPAPVPEQTPTN